MESSNQPGGSEAAAAKKALPQPAPLTPAVLQTSALSSQHLPPTLRARFLKRPRNKNRKRDSLKQTLPSRSGSPTETLNSKEARLKIRLLEEQQASGSAPTLPTTQHYPLAGQTTGLTIGQPSPVLPSSVQRGPWASTSGKVSAGDPFTSYTFVGRSVNRSPFSGSSLRSG